MTLAISDAVIVRGLSKDASRPDRKDNVYPPRVCQVVSIDGNQLRVRLRLGGMQRWNAKSRVTSIDNVARHATPREVAVGMPIDNVPKGQP